jgi:DNA-binding transcriptional regulator YdaS (Cro superfamily)
MEALERACQALGTKKALAEALGVHQSTISAWRARGRIPAEHVVGIERASGVPRHELRPDLYQIKASA